MSKAAPRKLFSPSSRRTPLSLSRPLPRLLPRFLRHFRPARRFDSFRYAFPVLCFPAEIFFRSEALFVPPLPTFSLLPPLPPLQSFPGGNLPTVAVSDRATRSFLFSPIFPDFRLSRCTHVSSRRPPLRQKAGGAGRHSISIRKKDGNYKSGLQSTGLFPRTDKCGRFLPARFASRPGKVSALAARWPQALPLPSAAIPLPSPRGSGARFRRFLPEIFPKNRFRRFPAPFFRRHRRSLQADHPFRLSDLKRPIFGETAVDQSRNNHD